MNVIHTPAYQNFMEALERAEMLFGPDVHEYLQDINKTVKQLYVHKAEQNKIIETGNLAEIQLGTELRTYLFSHLLRNETMCSVST